MVTFAFLITTVLLINLLAVFDMKLFEFSFFEALKNIFYAEIAIGRYITFLGAALGMISSLIIDYRIKTTKQESNADERKKE